MASCWCLACKHEVQETLEKECVHVYIDIHTCVYVSCMCIHTFICIYICIYNTQFPVVSPAANSSIRDIAGWGEGLASFK